jgi:hypothetical protein
MDVCGVSVVSMSCRHHAPTVVYTYNANLVNASTSASLRLTCSKMRFSTRTEAPQGKSRISQEPELILHFFPWCY